MPSTYSANLRLELIATGEAANTWGTKTNNSLNLLGDAISGYLQVALVDGVTSLTANDGSADQTRQASLEFTGALTGAAYAQVIGGVEGRWIVRNSCTGGTVTFRVSGGTGVAIPAGESLLVYSDGVSVWSVSPALTSISATYIYANKVVTPELSATTVTTSIANATLITATSVNASVVSATLVSASVVGAVYGGFSTKVSAAALEVSSAISGSSAVFSGNVCATNFYGNGSNLTGLGTGTVTSVGGTAGLTGTVSTAGNLSIDTNNALGIGAYSLLAVTSTVAAGAATSSVITAAIRDIGPAVSVVVGSSVGGLWRNMSGRTLEYSAGDPNDSHDIGLFIRVS